jgi:hypothetical protein
MPTPANRLEMSPQERVAWLHDTPRDVMPPELHRLFLLRRMDQLCPDCGRHEAAHPYCSLCFLPMDASDWYDRSTKPLGPMSARYAALLGGGETSAVEAEEIDADEPVDGSEAQSD